MASQSQGIRQLPPADMFMAHEQKNRGLMKAEEAQAETGQCPLQREKELKARGAMAVGAQGSCSREVVEESQEKAAVLQTYFWQNSNKVLDTLLALTGDIQPQIHEDYCING